MNRLFSYDILDLAMIQDQILECTNDWRSSYECLLPHYEKISMRPQILWWLCKGVLSTIISSWRSEKCASPQFLAISYPVKFHLFCMKWQVDVMCGYGLLPKIKVKSFRPSIQSNGLKPLGFDDIATEPIITSHVVFAKFLVSLVWNLQVRHFSYKMKEWDNC